MEQVLRWLIEGQTDADIIEAIAAHWPDQSPRVLLDLAVDELAKAGQADPIVIRGWCLMARRELYRKMLEIGDFAGALRATEKIESLCNKLK